MQSQLLRHLKFRELSYLVTLERIRSIHRAAELHGISQPALSKTLRELENVLGFKLFERSRRGVAPTKLGEIVIAQAMQMISNLDALECAARRRAPWPRRCLLRRRHAKSGTAPDSGAYTIARKKFPNLVVDLVEGSTDELLFGLRRGEYSLVVGRSSPQDSLSVTKQTPLYPELGVIVGRAGHPAIGRRRRKLETLLHFPWVLPRHGPTRSAIELAFMRAGCSPPSPSFVNYSTQLICEVLVRSDTLGVMPLGAVKAAARVRGDRRHPHLGGVSAARLRDL